MSVQPRMFRLDPLDRGVLFGFTRRQVVVLAVAIVAFLASTITRRHQLPTGITAAVLVAAAVAPVGGVSLVDWVPIWAGWLTTRPRRWSRPLHLLTVGANPNQPPLPSWLAGLTLVTHPDEAWGGVQDVSVGALTVVHPIAGSGFTTRDAAGMGLGLDGWAQLYTSVAAAGEDVARVCWTDIARPVPLDGHADWATRQPGHTTAAGVEYAAFVAGHTVMRHDQLVAVTLHTGSGRGGDRARLGFERHAQLTSMVRETLAAGGIETNGPAGVDEIAWLLRTGLDPASTPPAPHGTTAGCLVQRLGLVPISTAGPMRVEVARDHVTVDAVWHRSWWVEQWPTRELPADWFDPLLTTIPAGCRQRLFTVIVEPQPVDTATRELARAAASHGGDRIAASEGRARWDPWKQQRAEAVNAREREVQAGHTPLAYAAIITVTADTAAGLEVAGRDFERLATRHKVQVRRLWGRMHLGLAASLPLGIGLSRLEPR